MPYKVTGAGSAQGAANRRCAVPSAYPLRLPGRAQGNVPVRCALAPASRERFGDFDATNTRAVFL
ncbi:hypothetical protein ENC09_16215 [Shigella flexneri]|nr:hypothetical protein [Shigella flexneri]EFX5488950.1 hypothetical protein [Shigella flexneri]EFX5623186.1 hypothetical protein [Shigella flexneri]